jgi:hypothetical protein
MTALATTPAGSSRPAPPDSDDFRVRDAQWYAFAHGRRTAVTTSRLPFEPEPHDDGAPPLARSLPAVRRPFAPGVLDAFETIAYPAGRLPATGSAGAVDRALSLAFGVLRREPENPFNDHRAVPSVRAKFPVHAFVSDRAGHWLVDPQAHGLRRLGDRTDGEQLRISLAGRYPSLPPVYRWARGPLVNVELGINTRMAAIALELAGVPVTVQVPDEHGAGRLARLGLADPQEWGLPVVLTVGPRPGRDDPAGAATEPTAVAADPVLREVVAANRAQAGVRVAPERLGPAVPDLPSAHTRSWAEVLWLRTSGRMPRAMFGVNGVSRRLPADTLADLAAWAAVPPPSRLWREAFGLLRSTAVVQDVDGYADGRYRLEGGQLTCEREAPGLARELEKHYGYSLAPVNGCDIRRSQVLWFFSAPMAELVDRYGDAGWAAAQYATGWATQGLVLAAAAHGLYSRPNRAFTEIPSQGLLELEPDRMITLAVITGTARTSALSLDLRP